jgi:FkbM family methyltransferase
MRYLPARIRSLIKRTLPASTRKLIKNQFRYSSRVLKGAIGKEHLIGKDIRIRKVRLGQDNADWVVADRLVSCDSIVYSVGIGENISFDLALIERYGCRVYGWDPTPLAVNFIAGLKSTPGFVFMPYGLGVDDCTIQFGAQDGGDHSFSIHSQHPSKISLEVRKFTSMMKMLNHDRVDILKMDIEGSEYDVIRQIVEDKVIISLLLIEFHHRWYSNIPVEKTKEHIGMLKQAGYLIFDVSASGGEVSFVHKTALKKM